MLNSCHRMGTLRHEAQAPQHELQARRLAIKKTKLRWASPATTNALVARQLLLHGNLKLGTKIGTRHSKLSPSHASHQLQPPSAHEKKSSPFRLPGLPAPPSRLAPGRHCSSNQKMRCRSLRAGTAWHAVAAAGSLGQHGHRPTWFKMTWSLLATHLVGTPLSLHGLPWTEPRTMRTVVMRPVTNGSRVKLP